MRHPTLFLKGKSQSAYLVFHRSDGSFNESVCLRFPYRRILSDCGLLSRCNYAFYNVQNCRFLVGAEGNLFVAKSGNVPDYILNGTLESTALHFDYISKDRFAVAILHDQNGQGFIAV